MTPFIYFCLAVLCSAVVTYAESEPELELEPAGRLSSVCELPKEEGTCDDFTQFTSSYFYNTASGACEEFTYSGCGGNDNNFGSKEECVRTCSPKCLRPPVEGPISCAAYMPSYTFNATSGRCEPYVYGGCGSTGNVFPEYQECTRVCGSDCDLEPEAGDCNENYLSYFYNSTSERCEPIYGVCGGNANNFPARDWCIGKCAQRCYLEADPGPCEASFRRYYYNFRTQECEEFIYGGCRGNDNNFEDRNDCLDQCGNFCKQNPVTGPCKAAIPRFFYNSTSRACESFTYGGCDGGSNNFETEDKCNEICGSGYPMPEVLD